MKRGQETWIVFKLVTDNGGRDTQPSIRWPVAFTEPGSLNSQEHFTGSKVGNWTVGGGDTWPFIWWSVSIRGPGSHNCLNTCYWIQYEELERRTGEFGIKEKINWNVSRHKEYLNCVNKRCSPIVVVPTHLCFSQCAQ